MRQQTLSQTDGPTGQKQCLPIIVVGNIIMCPWDTDAPETSEQEVEICHHSQYKQDTTRVAKAALKVLTENLMMAEFSLTKKCIMMYVQTLVVA